MFAGLQRFADTMVGNLAIAYGIWECAHGKVGTGPLWIFNGALWWEMARRTNGAK